LIDFFGATNSNSSSWSWNLDVNGLGGVTPSTSNVQNPSNVLYSNSGIYDVRLTVSSGQSNCVVDTIITVLSLNNTGISTIDYEEIKIFPNPNNGCFSVKIPSIKSLSGGIYNHLGHKVEIFKSSDLRNNTFEFNFTEMKAGLYFIRLDNYPNFSHKIIISKN
jgi:PKD repeat protein